MLAVETNARAKSRFVFLGEGGGGGGGVYVSLPYSIRASGGSDFVTVVPLYSQIVEMR